jgi:hypothetical protein
MKCFSAATMATRTRLNVTLQVQWLPLPLPETTTPALGPTLPSIQVISWKKKRPFEVKHYQLTPSPEWEELYLYSAIWLNGLYKGNCILYVRETSCWTKLCVIFVNNCRNTVYSTQYSTCIHPTITFIHIPAFAVSYLNTPYLICNVYLDFSSRFKW